MQGRIALPPTRGRASSAAGAPFLPWLGAAVVIGAILRLYLIREQILLDDEWHAVRVLVWRNYRWILEHFGNYDHCIPLTFYDRLLMDTVGLSELGMRLPVLLCGLAGIVVLPLLVRRLIGPAAALVFAFLLAVSPVHVYFSRYARPYAVTMLLSFAAVAGFHLWWRGRRRRWGAVYCVAGAAAAYFHLAALPMILAPLPWAFLDALRTRDAKALLRSAARLGAVACALAALLALLLGPPWVVDGRSIMRKVGNGEPIGAAAILGAAEILFGTGSRAVLAGLAVLSSIGLVSLVRRFPGLSGFLGWLALVQIVAYGTTTPTMGEKPFVIARYHLWLLPILLMLLAQGVIVVAGKLRIAWAQAPPAGIGGVTALLLLAAGPIPGIYRAPNAWTNHGIYQYTFDPGARVAPFDIEPARLSAFYEDVRRREPGSVLLLEAPWSFKWYLNPYPYYQRFHRQRMKVGFVAPAVSKSLGYGELLAGQEGFEFRNAVNVGDLERVRALGTDYVVFHRDLGNELRQRPGEGFPDVTPWIERYRQLIGQPAHEDADIVVFKVR